MSGWIKRKALGMVREREIDKMKKMIGKLRGVKI